MLRIHILGSCSGTEPEAGRHHTAVLVELDGVLYGFDAGENAAWQSHTSGLDLPSLRALFVTHRHIDHVGGLPNLLWTLRKLDWCHPHCMAGKTVSLYSPCPDTIAAALAFLEASEKNFQNVFTIENHGITSEGAVFGDGRITVEARFNGHLGGEPSCSYRFRAADRTVVLSGDVRSIEELSPWLDEGCDLLLMETGHHAVDAVCRYVAARPGIRHLTFYHHGRAILDRFAEQWGVASGMLGADRVCFAHDGQIIPLDGPLNRATLPTVKV